jgi:hypothetical protein
LPIPDRREAGPDSDNQVLGTAFDFMKHSTVPAALPIHFNQQETVSPKDFTS